MFSFDTTTDTLRSITKAIEIFHDSKSISLSQYVKKSVVSSRCFIQDSIADESIVGDTLKVFQNIYIGYILVALQINQYVIGNKTIRDMLSVVATEGLVDNFLTPETLGSDLEYTFSKKYKPGMEVAIGVGEMRRDDKISFPSGKVVEVSFANPADKSMHFSANIFVHLNPRIVPNSIMEQFTALNYKAPIMKRWLMYKANEISFWRDFIFELDLLEKKRIAIKNDTSGELAELLKKQKNSIFKHILKIIKNVGRVIKNLEGVSADDRSKASQASHSIPGWQNIANSVLIYEKASFDRWCHDNSMNFRKFSDRQKFFSKSYGLCVITIDNMYDNVAMYFNGFESVCEYKFAQMLDSAKKDTMNLVAMMKQMSQNQAPNF